MNTSGSLLLILDKDGNKTLFQQHKKNRLPKLNQIQKVRIQLMEKKNYLIRKEKSCWIKSSNK
jgi:hypothetical protein